MNGYTSPTMTVLYHDQIIKTIHRKTFWRIKILKEAVFVVCEVDWQICKQNLLCWSAKVIHFNPLNASRKKWANTLKQFVGKLPMNCLSVFIHFVGLALKGLSLRENVKAHPNIILQLVKSDQGIKCFGQVSQTSSEIIAFIKSLFNFYLSN